MNNLPLPKRRCLACESLQNLLTKKNISINLKKIKNGWKVKGNSLINEYKFHDFKHALAFVNKIGKISEKQGHHPDITLSWGKVKIILSTHSLHGLTTNDFILASKISRIKKDY